MSAMNKQDLSVAVATAAGLASHDGLRAVEAVLATIAAALKAGDEVKLVGFGTFHITRREASSGRNPRTGEPMTLGARNQPKFTAGKGLREAVN